MLWYTNLAQAGQEQERAEGRASEVGWEERVGQGAGGSEQGARGTAQGVQGKCTLAKGKDTCVEGRSPGCSHASPKAQTPVKPPI